MEQILTLLQNLSEYRTLTALTEKGKTVGVRTRWAPGD